MHLRIAQKLASYKIFIWNNNSKNAVSTYKTMDAQHNIAFRTNEVEVESGNLILDFDNDSNKRST